MQIRAERSSSQLLSLAAALLTMLATSSARADQIDLASFKPSPFGNAIFRAESGQNAPAGTGGAAGWLQYQHNPIVVRDAAGTVSRVVIGNHWVTELTGSYSPLDWLGVGVALPVLVFQDGEGLPGGVAPATAGIGDLRLLPRVQLLNIDDGLVAVAAIPEVTVPIGQFFDGYLGESSFSVVPTVAASTKTQWFDATANVIYVSRFNTTLAQLSIRDEVGVRAGLAVKVWPEHVSILAEASGATQAFRPFEEPLQTRAEVAAGIRAFLPFDLAVTVGGGGSPALGVGTPDLRVFAALSWIKPPPGVVVVDEKPAEAVPPVAAPTATPTPTPPAPEPEPDLDVDGDGVPIPTDTCPDVRGPGENRGCPDTDRDGDTVVDRLDNCPDEAGTGDNNGCAVKQLVALTEGHLEIKETIYFQTGLAAIERRSFPLLDNVARVIGSHPELGPVTVEGHTDVEGNDEFNLKLSRDRAGAVKAHLVKLGVPEARLRTEGFGASRPVASNSTLSGKAMNRRVEFKYVAQAPGT